jgi:hypothetical protein
MDAVEVHVVNDLLQHKFGTKTHSQQSEQLSSSHAEIFVFQALHDLPLAAPFPWTIV